MILMHQRMHHPFFRPADVPPSFGTPPNHVSLCPPPAARKRLNPSGLVSLNVYAPGGDRTLARAVAATMGTVFPTVLEFPLAEESVLLGFREKTTVDRLAPLLSRSDVPGERRGIAGEARRVLAPAAAFGRPLVDDLAPVEQLTHAMIERRDRRRRARGAPS